MGWEQDRSDPNLYTTGNITNSSWVVDLEAVKFHNPPDRMTMQGWLEPARPGNPRVLEARIKEEQVRVVGHPWVPAMLRLN